jgi:endonuclease/exonuclease/phosphatase family metal-dependent hydrolase
VPLTLVTWNVHGSGGIDPADIAAHLDEVGADVAVLQEIQRPRAVAVGRLLGAAGSAWCFKHQASPTRAEGLAVVVRAQPVDAACRGLTAARRWWSWRRRVVQLGHVEVDGARVLLVHTHLTPHPDGQPAREREARAVLAALGEDTSRCVVAGDLNCDPTEPAMERFRGAGLSDAWEVAGTRVGAGWTNWSSADAAVPDQRLDYVLCGAGLQVDRAAVPDPDAVGATGQPEPDWRARSDHLPLTVTISLPAHQPQGPPPSG